MTKSLRFALLAGAALVVAAGAGIVRAQSTPPDAPDPSQPPAPARVRTSPHETVGAVIGDRRTGPRITITYGRPFTKHPKSGEVRKIWGGLVAWDKPDRLGADEATLLLTQAALKFGDVTIPAGAYTLYIVPSETGVSRLAFSSALGKWGVPVDESRDVARIALEKHTLAAPIDQLTIAVEGNSAGDGGLLKIAWETTQFAAAFTVAK
ncbi:MAG: DUF2911 domain-containing protein [Opitutaceae bacterium]|nr:DUF2911 domain-containing protein [Opitutaceae bacterium]